MVADISIWTRFLFESKVAFILHPYTRNLFFAKNMEKSDLVAIEENLIGEDAPVQSADEESVDGEDVEAKANEAIDAISTIGRISLQFYDGICPSDANYPKSYYTVNGKERLLLIFAENFRRQYVELNPKRNPLVLAVPNECEIQKFVSTTLRSSVFLFPELIDCWHGPAQFVADFIRYEPLDDQTAMVSKKPKSQYQMEMKRNRFLYFIQGMFY